ncbi:MAG: serine dehydratase subunit alpha family protein [Candidatus Schekmanbacteria bacterium]|nr:MAG: serine dehydratase subunit alpha family protein [Candidatus Schekmanbacteria bacterium]
MNVSMLLRKIVVPATGCTEPAAVGLAVALSVRAVNWEIPKWLHTKNVPQMSKGNLLDSPDNLYKSINDISVTVDRRIYKNALSVGIPNTGGEYGLPLASALGIFCNPENGLTIFKEVDAKKLGLAKKLVSEKKIKISLPKHRIDELYIEVSANIAIDNKNVITKTLIRFSHENVIFIKRGKKVLYEKYAGAGKDKGKKEIFSENLTIEGRPLSSFKVSEICKMARNISAKDREFMLETLNLNLEASKLGMVKNVGLGIGKSIIGKTKGKNRSKAERIKRIRSLVASASDARMAGENITLASSSGSGNMGALVTLSIFAAAEAQGTINKKLLAESLALGHLITAYLTEFIGILSPLCGSSAKGGIGAAAGITRILGGNDTQVEKAMKNMISTLSGVICDGAKMSCALKVAEAAGIAYECACLALENIEVPFTDGIAGKTIEETISNLRSLSLAMGKAEDAIIKVMQKKKF